MGVDLISVADAAALLGVTAQGVHQRIADGVLTEYRKGRTVLVDRAELEAIR